MHSSSYLQQYLMLILDNTPSPAKREHNNPSHCELSGTTHPTDVVLQIAALETSCILMVALLEELYLTNNVLPFLNRFIKIVYLQYGEKDIYDHNFKMYTVNEYHYANTEFMNIVTWFTVCTTLKAIIHVRVITL